MLLLLLILLFKTFFSCRVEAASAASQRDGGKAAWYYQAERIQDITPLFSLKSGGVQVQSWMRGIIWSNWCRIPAARFPQSIWMPPIWEHGGRICATHFIFQINSFSPCCPTDGPVGTYTAFLSPAPRWNAIPNQEFACPTPDPASVPAGFPPPRFQRSSAALLQEDPYPSQVTQDSWKSPSGNPSTPWIICIRLTFSTALTLCSVCSNKSHLPSFLCIVCWTLSPSTAW